MDALLIAEVAATLVRYNHLRCALDIDLDDGSLLVTLQVVGEPGDPYVLSLRDDLRYIHDVATLRAIATRYDIPAAALEALLPKERDE